MTMAMSSVLAFRKWKDKSCCAEDASLNTNVKCYSKNEHNCFWNNSDNYCYWSKHNCSGNKSSNNISFKIMLMLVWSKSRERNSYLNDKLLKFTFSRDSNDNKLNRWMRIRKEKQIQFLCPWLNQILNLFVTANNNKRSKSVCVMEVLIGNVGKEYHVDVGRT